MEMDYYSPYKSPAKRKVLGDIHNTPTAESPISPTANLKLLTKVASQFDSIENVNCCNLSGTPPHPTCLKKSKGVRKFKSLGFLCDKFLKLYPLEIGEGEDQYCYIMLSDLANKLCVEKRRIYDIINVMESLQMATKVAKNSYLWIGCRKLTDTLSQLRAYAEQIGLLQYVRMLQLNRKMYIKLQNEEMEITKNSSFLENSNISSFFRNERRIGILCQKFIMLFLVSFKDGLVNLELAAQVLVGDNCQQNKTRLRRLYDIANILVSLGVISRVNVSICKKPVFKYAGPSLHHLDHIDSDKSVLGDLVKTESSDSLSSDQSEDSNEVLCRLNETINHPMHETDHSYSLDMSRSMEKTAGRPAAKKRLVFSDSLKTQHFSKVIAKPRVIPDHNVELVPVTPTLACKPCVPSPTILRVLGQGSKPQPITNGGVYKAVRVGNDIQLIRIDSCSSDQS